MADFLFSGFTDAGIIRENNEDNFERFVTMDGETLVMVVSDGMGGMQYGEVASKIVVDKFIRFISRQDLDECDENDFRQLLDVALSKANKEVYRIAHKEDKRGMGATAVACILQGRHAVYANIGDSRGYIFSDGKLKQITKDHSYVAELVSEGILTPEEARTHTRRNEITRAVGVERNVLVDTFVTEIKKEDIVLLCSDGLTNMVTDEQICKIISENKDLDTIAGTLIEKAKEAGGRDNITVLVAKLSKEARVG